MPLNRRPRLGRVAAAFALACPAVAAAAVPFNAAGASAFDPQVSVVNSGVVLDAQAVVSADRKYVTLNMRPQNAALVALREFQFQNGRNPGLVGVGPVNNGIAVNGANAANPQSAAKGAAAKPAVAPAAPAAPASVLLRPGMTRITPRGS